MLEKINTEDILFLDIETVPQFPSYEDMPDDLKAFWDKKAERLIKEDEAAEELYPKSAVYAEFGKIVCISAGMFFNKDNNRKLRIKSFYGDYENRLLEDFKDVLENTGQSRNTLLCAHNGKEFDFPFLARRMLINGMKLPAELDVAGKKPWETPFVDTMELWKFGDFKHYTSLNLLTKIFDIPSPKDDIDGSMVGKVYHMDGDIKRIVDYCEKDVIAVVQLFLRYKGEELIRQENIESVTE